MLLQSCRQCRKIRVLSDPGSAFAGNHIVISPLISLMQDQVKALNEAGVQAAFINSSLSEKDYNETIRKARQGHLQNYLYSTGAARHRGLSRSRKKRTWFQW